MNPGRWFMAIAKRHRAALVAAGEESPPAMIDVTVSLMIAYRAGYAIDHENLLKCPERDLIAAVGFIHNNIDRKTGQVASDLFAPPKGENA